MNKKKKTHPFFRILSVLFFIFISLYVAEESGYYDSRIAKKTAMTEESIKQFEQDIKDNKPIDLKDYTYEEHKDYRNNTTDTAIYISKRVEKFMSSGINDLFNILKSLVT